MLLKKFNLLKRLQKASHLLEPLQNMLDTNNVIAFYASGTRTCFEKYPILISISTTRIRDTAQMMSFLPSFLPSFLQILPCGQFYSFYPRTLFLVEGGRHGRHIRRTLSPFGRMHEFVLIIFNQGGTKESISSISNTRQDNSIRGQFLVYSPNSDENIRMCFGNGCHSLF
jgi:hypothetical protein